jgi:hypothetical protein
LHVPPRLSKLVAFSTESRITSRENFAMVIGKYKFLVLQ